MSDRGVRLSGLDPAQWNDEVRAILAAALENVRPGINMIWDGDGAMTHDDAMRSLRLMGSEVLPALRVLANAIVDAAVKRARSEGQLPSCRKG